MAPQTPQPPLAFTGSARPGRFFALLFGPVPTELGSGPSGLLGCCVGTVVTLEVAESG